MEKQISNIILGVAGPQDRFKVRWCGINLRLKIKPLTARQIIEISGEASFLKDIDTDNEMFPEMLVNSQDLWHMSRIIAIATGTRFKNIVARAILKLPLSDLGILFKIVRKQSDPEVFFYILASIKGLNKMKKPQEQ